MVDLTILLLAAESVLAALNDPTTRQFGRYGDWNRRGQNDDRSTDPIVPSAHCFQIFRCRRPHGLERPIPCRSVRLPGDTQQALVQHSPRRAVQVGPSYPRSPESMSPDGWASSLAVRADAAGQAIRLPIVRADRASEADADCGANACRRRCHTRRRTSTLPSPTSTVEPSSRRAHA